MFFYLTLSNPKRPYDVLLNSPNCLYSFLVSRFGEFHCFILDRLLCKINYFILITKQPILCEYCNENLHTHKLAWAERAEQLNDTYIKAFISFHTIFTWVAYSALPQNNVVGSKTLVSQIKRK